MQWPTLTARPAPTLAEKLATAIADGILNGTLKPGLRLDEISLAQQHGVSRTPVREALRQLTTSGPDRHAAAQGRRGLQGDARAGREPVRRHGRDGGDLRAARRHEHDADRASPPAGPPRGDDRRSPQAGDPDAYSDANVAFHSAIYAGAHNAPIAELHRSACAAASARSAAPSSRSRAASLRSTQEHDAVVRAILAGDAAGAHAAMLHHVGLVEDAFEAFAATNAA